MRTIPTATSRSSQLRKNGVTIQRGTRLYPYSTDRRSLEVVSVSRDKQSIKVKTRGNFGAGSTRVISRENLFKNYEAVAGL